MARLHLISLVPILAILVKCSTLTGCYCCMTSMVVVKLLNPTLCSDINPAKALLLFAWVSTFLAVNSHLPSPMGQSFQSATVITVAPTIFELERPNLVASPNMRIHEIVQKPFISKIRNPTLLFHGQFFFSTSYGLASFIFNRKSES
jgi:hypothetical protein